MDPLFLFGLGVAIVGFAGIGTAWNACREASSLSRIPGMPADRMLLGAMLFIMIVDVGIAAGGLWIALAVAGGARG